jgi:hypothetical protein
VSNGLDAWSLILRGYDIGVGDEVILKTWAHWAMGVQSSRTIVYWQKKLDCYAIMVLGKNITIKLSVIINRYYVKV